ncbi:hypothetical protein SEVIR_7G090501v4 [Setaria viridis]
MGLGWLAPVHHLRVVVPAEERSFALGGNVCGHGAPSPNPTRSRSRSAAPVLGVHSHRLDGRRRLLGGTARRTASHHSAAAPGGACDGLLWYAVADGCCRRTVVHLPHHPPQLGRHALFCGRPQTRTVLHLVQHGEDPH